MKQPILFLFLLATLLFQALPLHAAEEIKTETEGGMIDEMQPMSLEMESASAGLGEGQEAPSSGAEIERLDPQIQALKEEVLDLNALLFRLQEDLLFPPDTSVIVFLSISGGHYFTLDSVKLMLNDKMVSSYLYTDREVRALKKGGIQRLYTGNLKSGEHELVAVFSGIGPQQKAYKRAETITITKAKDASFIKLIIHDDPIKKQAAFTHESWN